jgi:hypothetical protein
MIHQGQERFTSSDSSDSIPELLLEGDCLRQIDCAVSFGLYRGCFLMNPRGTLRHHLPAASSLYRVRTNYVISFVVEFGDEIKIVETRPWGLSDDEMNAALGINIPNCDFATSFRSVPGNS